MANIALRPLRAKFYGAFVTTPGNDYDQGFGSTFDLDADWKPRIDALKSAGANVMFYSSAVHIGHAMLSVYLANRRAIIEYCARAGIYAMTYAAPAYSDWFVTDAQAIAVIAADAQMQAEFPNVPGFVTWDEPWTQLGLESNAAIVARVAAVYNAVKAVVPANFSVCGAPNPGGNNVDVFDTSGAAGTRMASTAPYCDFFAFHPFYAATVSNHASVRALYPGKELIFPSSVAMVESNPLRGPATAAMVALANDPTGRGMGIWTGFDYDANQYGLFNADYSVRPSMTVLRGNIAQTWPKRQIRAFRGKPRLNAYLPWGYQ